MNLKSIPVNKSKHEFTFYKEDISLITKSLQPNNQLRIEDKNLYHRIEHVLRLKPQEKFIIFDRSEHVVVALQYTEKKKYVVGTMVKKAKNITLKPNITFLLPLLKKDNFESALYTLVELGIQTIQPIITQKSQKKWQERLVNTRYLNILISAAEQSKNFAFPTLQAPVGLEQYLRENNSQANMKIYFDADGDALWEKIEQIKTKKIDKIVLMVGPEGDLTLEEKHIIKQNNFIFCKLTPTVLRSFQAVTVGVGTIRSLL